MRDKNLPGFKNLFLIYKYKNIWSHGLGEAFCRYKSAEICLQQMRMGSFQPLSWDLGEFPSRVLYKAVSSGASQKTQPSALDAAYQAGETTALYLVLADDCMCGGRSSNKETVQKTLGEGVCLPHFNLVFKLLSLGGPLAPSFPLALLSS